MKINAFISLLVLLSSVSYGFDCSTKTFTTLSHLMNDPVKESFWTKQIFPNGEEQAPILIDAIKIWNKNKPNNELVEVYSLQETVKTGEFNLSFEENKPYIWIGYPSKEFVAAEDENELHACIGYFYNDRVLLVTTVSIKETDTAPTFCFLFEVITVKELIERTVLVYKVDNIKDPRSIYDVLP